MNRSHYIEDEYGVLYTKDGSILVGYNKDVFRCSDYRIKDGVVKIAANAFNNCQSLKSVYMPNSVVEDEGSIFEGCKNLEEARLSANHKNPDIAMFCGCSLLHRVELREGLESIGENMFCGCESLREVILPSTIKVLGSDCFCGSGIEKILLPERLEYVGADAFISCYNLKELIIPSTVVFIGPWFVQGHKDFEGIICKSALFRIENDALISNKDNSLLACWSKSAEYHIPTSVKNIRSVCNDHIETLYVDSPLDEIGYEAFINCPSLQKVVYNATVRTNRSMNWKRF